MQGTNSELGVKRWSVFISIRERDRGIAAEADLYWPGSPLKGAGLVPLEPARQLAVGIGDEMAAARALSDLATQLFGVTAQDIDTSEQGTAAKL